MGEGAGTSVGVITLDLRIVSRLNEQLNAIAAAANQSAQRSFENLGKTVERSVSEPAEKAGKTLSEAITEPVKSAQKTVQDTLKKTQKQTDDTMSQINAAIAEQRRKAQEAVKEKITLPETVPRHPSATASEIFARQGKSLTDGSAASLPDLSDTFQPATEAADLLRQKLANIQMQFDAEREKLATLNSEFSKVAVGSKAWDELSKKITAAEGRLISLQSTMNATQAKIDAPAKKAAAAAEKAAAVQAKAQERAAKVAQQAAEKTARVQERAARQSTKVVESSARRKRSASTFTLRMQTNAMLSAMTSTSKGIARVGIMGRALSTNLLGSFKLAVPLALAAAAFGVLRKSFSMATANSNQFKESLNQVKANLEVAFTPIYQAILPALKSLMSWLAAATKQIAVFMAALFGKTYAQEVAATKKLQKNVADAANSSSGKSNDKTVASFDKLNIIGKKDSDAGDTGGVDYDKLDTKGTQAAESLADKFKSAWAGIASAFQDWVVKPITENLSKFDAPVAKFKALFSNIGKQFQQWMAPVGNWFQTDFKTAFANGIGGASTILSGFMDSLATVADTIWNTVQPAIDWFVKNGLPLLTSIAGQAGGTIVVAFEAVKTVFDTLWHGVVEPFAEFISKIVVDILSTFQSLWNQYGEPIFQKINTAINNTRDIVIAVWNNFLKPIFDQLFKTLNELWTEHLQPLVAKIGELVAKLIGFALDIYNGFIAPIVKWFVKTLGPPIAKVLSWIIKNIGDTLGAIIDTVGDIIKVLGGVIDFLDGVFTGDWGKAWKGIQEIFGGVFGALYDIAKTPLNAVIGLINSAIGGINTLIRGLNKVHIDIPDNPITGALSVGFSIPSIPSIPYLANGGVLTQPTLTMMGEYSGAKSNPEIATPKSLLHETIVEANGELVTAISSLTRQIIQAIRENGGRGDIYLDGKKIAANTIQQINSITGSAGKSPLLT